MEGVIISEKKSSLKDHKVRYHTTLASDINIKLLFREKICSLTSPKSAHQNATSPAVMQQ